MGERKSARWKDLPENLKGRVIEIQAGSKMIEEMERRMLEFAHEPEKKPKRSKYGNKHVEYKGYIFASIKEKDRFIQLELAKFAKQITDFEIQPEFGYWVTYSGGDNSFMKHYKYFADFKVIYPDGHVEIEDVKGSYKGGQTREFRRKKMIVEKLYNIKIIIV